jgi:hypothetical protein
MRIFAPTLLALLLMVVMAARANAFDAKSFFEQQDHQSGGQGGG